jgi:hypothetical protein
MWLTCAASKSVALFTAFKDFKKIVHFFQNLFYINIKQYSGSSTLKTIKLQTWGDFEVITAVRSASKHFLKKNVNFCN